MAIHLGIIRLYRKRCKEIRRLGPLGHPENMVWAGLGMNTMTFCSLVWQLIRGGKTNTPACRTKFDWYPSWMSGSTWFVERIYRANIWDRYKSSIYRYMIDILLCFALLINAHLIELWIIPPVKSHCGMCHSRRFEKKVTVRLEPHTGYRDPIVSIQMICCLK